MSDVALAPIFCVNGIVAIGLALIVVVVMFTDRGSVITAVCIWLVFNCH